MCYLSPGLIVVQVHQPPGVFLDLAGVHETPRKLHAVFDISWAASPFPALLLVIVALLVLVTTTLAQIALATRCGYCMGNSSGRDGISERCFPAAWRNRIMLIYRIHCYSNIRFIEMLMDVKEAIISLKNQTYQRDSRNFRSGQINNLVHS